MKFPFRLFFCVLFPIVLTSATLPTERAVSSGEQGTAKRLGAGIPTSVAVTPDGQIVAVGTSIGVYLLSAENLNMISFWETGEWVSHIAYSQDGQLLRVNEVVYDPTQGIQIGLVEDTSQWVEDHCSQDGMHCASTQAYAGHFTVKNTQTLVVEALVSQWYTKDFAWSPDGSRLYTVSGGKSPSFSERSAYLGYSLRVYDTRTWKAIAAVEGIFTDTLNQVFSSGDSRKIATYGARVSWRRNALIWDLETGQFIETSPCSVKWRESWNCTTPPVDFTWHQVYIRDLETGVLQRRFAPHRVYLWAAKLSHDARVLVTSGENDVAGKHLYESSIDVFRNKGFSDVRDAGDGQRANYATRRR